jgi:hypothetical protein
MAFVEDLTNHINVDTGACIIEQLARMNREELRMAISRCSVRSKAVRTEGEQIPKPKA